MHAGLTTIVHVRWAYTLFQCLCACMLTDWSPHQKSLLSLSMPLCIHMLGWLLLLSTSEEFPLSFNAPVAESVPRYTGMHADWLDFTSEELILSFNALVLYLWVALHTHTHVHVYAHVYVRAGLTTFVHIRRAYSLFQCSCIVLVGYIHTCMHTCIYACWSAAAGLTIVVHIRIAYSLSISE